MTSVLDLVRQVGILPTISVKDPEDIVPVCKALVAGGLPVGEVTLRTEASMEALALGVKEVPEITLGVGTVLDPSQAAEARAAGAAFVVTPGANPKVMEYCASESIPMVPGCSSGGEIETANSFGFQIVKFFPMEPLGGLKTLKALSGPYRNVTFVPMGGINEGNIADYISLRSVAACGGSWIAADSLIAEKDFAGIEERARRALNAMFDIHLAHVGINTVSAAGASDVASALAALLGKSTREGNSSFFVGPEVEVMKTKGRGAFGHLAFSTRTLSRLCWHLEQRDYTFAEDTAKYKNGQLAVIYLEDEIASFAIHFIQA